MKVLVLVCIQRLYACADTIHSNLLIGGGASRSCAQAALAEKECERRTDIKQIMSTGYLRTEPAGLQ